MKITADTNVLLRLLIEDDIEQAEAASRTLAKATLTAISVQTLCEIVWVVQAFYKVSRADTLIMLRRLMEFENVVVNRPVVEAGLRVLEAGGDFADGVIAFDGALLGGETFVSFDKRAIRALKEVGHPCSLPA